MPLYEYQCRSCNRISEVIQRMDDAPPSTCDECGGELKKLLSAPAFQFKGSGWYVTDYAKGSGNGKPASGAEDAKAKSGAESDSGDTAKSGSGDTAKSGSGDTAKSEPASAASPKPEGKTKSERISSD